MPEDVVTPVAIVTVPAFAKLVSTKPATVREWTMRGFDPLPAYAPNGKQKRIQVEEGLDWYKRNFRVNDQARR